MTSLAAERAEQARWKLRPPFAALPVFDRLLENEFAPPEVAAAEEALALRTIVDFALVTALDGPCPCGRTLPVHGEVHGRRSPQGTLAVVAALRGALQQMPASLVRDVRRYQIHQFRDGRFELKLVAVAPISAEFRNRMAHAWPIAAGTGAPILAIREVEDISIHTDGTKFDDFVSEYFEKLR